MNNNKNPLILKGFSKRIKEKSITYFSKYLNSRFRLVIYEHQTIYFTNSNSFAHIYFILFERGKKSCQPLTHRFTLHKPSMPARATRGWSQKPGTHYRVPHGWDDLNTSAITCCLPEHARAGTWNKRWSQDWNPGTYTWNAERTVSVPSLVLHVCAMCPSLCLHSQKELYEIILLHLCFHMDSREIYSRI